MLRGMLVVALVAMGACGGGDDDGGGTAIDAQPAADAAPVTPVGRVCALGGEAGADYVAASPALDCPSRICLHHPDDPATTGLCTADCVTAADCVAAAETPCTTFACEAPLAVGPFADRSLCVCTAR